MNREVDRADELLKYAHEAVACSDYDHALNLLRKAASIAPLRKDIKLYMAEVLSMGPAPLPGNATSLRHDTSISDAVRHLEPPTEDSGSSTTLRRAKKKENALRNFFASVRSAARGAASEDAGLEIGNSVARVLEEPARYNLDLPDPTSHTRMAIEAESEYDSSHSASGSLPELEPNVTVLRPGRRKAERVTASRTVYNEPPSAFTPVKETPRRKRVDNDKTSPPEKSDYVPVISIEKIVTALESPSPRLVAYFAVYGIIFLFVCTASAVSYAKFFRQNRSGKQLVASAPARVQSQTSTAPSVPANNTEEEMLHKARSFNSAKQYEKTMDLLSEYIKGAQASVTRDKLQAELAHAYNIKGTSLLENNKIAESVDAYSKAVELAPKTSLYHVHLANAYYYCSLFLEKEKTNDYLAKAASTLDKAIDLDGKNVQAHQLLATVYVNQKKPADARVVYSKIVKIAPSSTEAALAQQRMKTLSMAK